MVFPPHGDRHPFDRYVTNVDEDTWRVAHAALLFAGDFDPGADVDAALGRLDDLAGRVAALGPRTPGERVEAMRLVLVQQEGFTGNRHDYYDVRNSLLHAVLDRRTGIPITLSAVWMDVAGQLGWPVYGLALPGHFMIEYHSIDEPPIVLDPFEGGERLSREGTTAHLQAVTGAPLVVQPEAFAPATKRAILARMLANLFAICARQHDWPRLRRILYRQLALTPESEEVRENLRIANRRAAELN